MRNALWQITDALNHVGSQTFVFDVADKTRYDTTTVTKYTRRLVIRGVGEVMAGKCEVVGLSGSSSQPNQSAQEKTTFEMIESHAFQ